ncbi:MAG: S1/P1 nuclease [Gammaproteobacteria bacterium]|nr:S1/P1 nuclease [Gammaproteobacteria bacterium]
MKILLPMLLAGLTVFGAPVAAWDSVGHRVSAQVAVEYLDPGVRERLVAILRGHPRFTEDFLEQVPGFIDTGDELEFDAWLLGQAAFWPDIARGLPRAERARYHRGNWHYIDGAWLRDAATAQGNVYVGIDPFPDIAGPAGEAIRDESDVDNVVVALDYNMRLLADPATEAGQRAVALCWVLHLAGDIHQPLHTGSLFSAQLFESGDAGGNGIETSEGNLHAVWDRALREQGILDSVDSITDALQSMDLSEIESEPLDWTAWMHESRALMTSVAYPETVEREILAAERTGRDMREIELSEDYLAEMRRLSEQRLGLAGLRIALLFNRNL